jgi:maltose O-acetyltransferase
MLIKLNLADVLKRTIYPIKIIKLRGAFYKLFFRRSGYGLCIDKHVNFRGKINITIGENCVINSFVHIWAGPAGLVIGDRVMIASHVSITTLTHDYYDGSMRFAPAIDRKIVNGDDVWIGSHAVIMPGISIGKEAVVGAGAVVTKDVAENTIVAGLPAQIIKLIKQ